MLKKQYFDLCKKAGPPAHSAGQNALSALLDVPMNEILVPSESTEPLRIQSKSHGRKPVALAFSTN